MKPYYIFIDVDGTLLSHKDHAIPPSAIEAIHSLQAKGHKIFVCTGRSACELPKFVRDIEFDGYVTNCGGIVEVNQAYIEEHPLSLNQLLPILEEYDNDKVGYKLEGKKNCYLAPFAYDHFCSLFAPSCNFDLNATFQAMESHHMKQMKDYDPNDLYTKVSVYAKDPSYLQQLEKILQNDYTCVAQYHEEVCYVEIYAKHISKATGVDAILHKFKADQTQTIGIGDSLNDLDMIKFCQVGVAMGNAVQGLKDHSDIVCGHVDEDGLATYLSSLIV